MGPSEHRFTISSAPAENHVAITTRPSDTDFKRALFSLLPGQAIAAHSVEGFFIWQHTDAPPVFVAAGVGITPFRAMIAQRVHQGLPLVATLLFGGPKLIFRRDITAWQRRHPQLHVLHIADRRLAASDVLPHLNSQNLIYISGPSGMVHDISQSLIQQHGIPAQRITRDLFTGLFT